jgi:hypothetical protein
MTKNLLKVGVVLAVAFAPSLVLAAGASASTGMTASTGAEFGSVKTTTQGWALGDLGIAIATAAGIFGTVNAVGGNIKMAAIGIGVAFLGAFSPSVIESIYGATI